MPQVTWEINKAMALSAGVNIPVSSENDYRYLLEFSVKFDHAPLSVKINVNPVTCLTFSSRNVRDILRFARRRVLNLLRLLFSHCIYNGLSDCFL